MRNKVTKALRGPIAGHVVTGWQADRRDASAIRREWSALRAHERRLTHDLRRAVLAHAEHKLKRCADRLAHTRNLIRALAPIVAELER